MADTISHHFHRRLLWKAGLRAASRCCICGMSWVEWIWSGKDVACADSEA